MEETSLMAQVKVGGGLAQHGIDGDAKKQTMQGLLWRDLR